MNDTNTGTDLLKIEGINSKGFGIVSKFILFDTDISIEAKTIYSYLCSLAGNGTTAFPCRDTILGHLHISKSRYYSHFSELVNNGYIVIQKDKKVFPFKNVYIIVSNPRKFQESPVVSKSKLSANRLKFSGMKSFGFGIVPYAVMTDERLDIKAKGLYAYFCGYAGCGESAFPRKELILFHLNLSEKPYYKYYNQLLSLNYLEIKQRTVAGKFNVCDYYINETPNVEEGTRIQKERQKKKQLRLKKSPHGTFQDNGEVATGKRFLPHGTFPDSTKPDSIKPDSIKPDTTNEDSNITNRTKPNINITSQSINQESITHDSGRLNDGSEQKLKEIFEAIGIDRITHKERIEDIKGVIMNLWLTRKVNKTYLKYSTIESILSRLSAEKIDIVIDNIIEASKKKPIGDVTEYYKTALCNAAYSINLQQSAMLNYSENHNKNKPTYDLDLYEKFTIEQLLS